MTGMEPLLAAGGVWLWENYGKDAFAWLVNRGAKKIEDLKKAGWDKVDWALASHTYREEMLRLYGSMQILGMREAVPVSEIFTDVYLLDTPSAWRRHAIENLANQLQIEAQEEPGERRRKGLELVRQQQRLFILGKPGVGKTTFMKYLTILAVQSRLDAIPIFVSLKAWSDTGFELMPFLVKRFAICRFPEAQPFIEEILDSGKAVVLFDGLDEVNLEGGARERITRAVRDFADQYGSSRVVITCRTAATDYMFERFRYCELADFTPEQAGTFVTRWFQRDEAKREAFLKEFAKEENQRLQDLARTPLLLTLLCLSFEETMHFPLRRAEIYKDAIEALLRRWDSSRSIKRDELYRKLSLGHKEQLLIELAADTFERGELFMRQRELAQRIVAFVRRLPPADSSEDVDGAVVLRAIEAQHGLLIERARAIYSFSHLTFHEYFAARYVCEHAEPAVLDGLINHTADPRWREVTLLVASMLDYRNAARLFDFWHTALQARIVSDTTVRRFFQWAERQSCHAGDGTRADRRALLVWLTLTDDVFSVLARDLVFDSSGTFARARAHIRTRTRSRDLAHTLAHTLAYDSSFDLAVTLAYELTSALKLDSAFDLTLSLANDTARASIRDLTRAFARHSALARQSALSDYSAVTGVEERWLWWYQVVWIVEFLPLIRVDPELSGDFTAMYNALAAGLNDLIKNGRDVELAQACLAALLPVSAMEEARWVTFAQELRRLLAAHLDIGHVWEFSDEQIKLIDNYLTSAMFLVECLDLATVEDRGAIHGRLLLPDSAAVQASA